MDALSNEKTSTNQRTQKKFNNDLNERTRHGILSLQLSHFDWPNTVAEKRKKNITDVLLTLVNFN